MRTRRYTLHLWGDQWNWLSSRPLEAAVCSSAKLAREAQNLVNGTWCSADGLGRGTVTGTCEVCLALQTEAVEIFQREVNLSGPYGEQEEEHV